MPGLREWVRTLIARGKRSAPQSTIKPSESVNDQPPVPPPKALHRSCWDRTPLKSGTKQDGFVSLHIFGLPGIGKKSLWNKLVYEAIKGQEPYDPNPNEFDYPFFVCGDYTYNLELNGHHSSVFPVPPWVDYDRRDFFGIIFAFDVLSRESWKEISRLHNALTRGVPSRKRTVPILVLGLKADLDGQGERVPRAEAEEFARLNGYRYAECSALTGEGVYEAFGSFVEDTYSTARRFEGDNAGRQSQRDRSLEAFLSAIECLDVRYTRITGRDLGLW